MDKLYSYYLHYNPYTGYWNAVLRDKSNEYLNGRLTENEVLKSKDINDIIKFISSGQQENVKSKQ